jgi:hypothetical protein
MNAPAFEYCPVPDPDRPCLSFRLTAIPVAAAAGSSSIHRNTAITVHAAHRSADDRDVLVTNEYTPVTLMSLAGRKRRRHRNFNLFYALSP